MFFINHLQCAYYTNKVFHLANQTTVTPKQTNKRKVLSHWENKHFKWINLSVPCPVNSLLEYVRLVYLNSPDMFWYIYYKYIYWSFGKQQFFFFIIGLYNVIDSTITQNVYHSQLCLSKYIINKDDMAFLLHLIRSIQNK